VTTLIDIITLRLMLIYIRFSTGSVVIPVSVNFNIKAHIQIMNINIHRKREYKRTLEENNQYVVATNTMMMRCTQTYIGLVYIVYVVVGGFLSSSSCKPQYKSDRDILIHGLQYITSLSGTEHAQKKKPSTGKSVEDSGRTWEHYPMCVDAIPG